MISPVSTSSKIFVAGHNGMVGSALVRSLRQHGYQNLVLRTRQELDLLDQAAVKRFMADERPAYIFTAAAKVGGILANNTYRAEFIYQNLTIAGNIIHSAYCAGVERLMYLGSSCIYPRECPQPMAEESLLSGPLEPTNEPYAVAKIAGIKMCEAYNQQYGTRYIAAMPTNLYGPGDSYDLETSHVLPALIRKVHEAGQNDSPRVTIWGTGAPRREFLYCEDLANALVFLMKRNDEVLASCSGRAPFVNVGCGVDISIRELAETVGAVLGYPGGFEFDTTKPDGMYVKRLDVSRLSALGWQPKVSLREGIEAAYADYLGRLNISERAVAARVAA
jgi:GDP-L-fucose synthase